MVFYHGSSTARRFLSSSTLDTLKWWRRRLEDAHAFQQPELHHIGPLRDHRVHVDASTSWAISIVIGRKWYTFRLVSGWKQEGLDICWLEAIAIELLYHFLVQLGYRDVHLPATLGLKEG